MKSYLFSRTMLKSSLLLFALLLIVQDVSSGQNGSDTDHQPGDERGSFEARRKMILDGNNLRATYHNFGWGGRLDGDAVDEVTYEFPRNTNRVYIALVAFFVGAEVNNQAETGPEQFPIVLTPNGRESPDGSSWDMNPVPGYYNPAVPEQFARSDRPETWPSVWPDKMDDETDPGWSGSWNGYFGKDQFSADQEFFYRASGNEYTRFSEPTNPDNLFRPDLTDPSRGGLGLIIDARIMAWSQTLINDVHFNIFEIRNDGSFDYDRMAFTLWIADLVGGGGNDLPEFDERSAISYLTHLEPRTGRSHFGDTRVGMAGIQFLETPGNSIDGIDNDGDSDNYLPGSGYYNPDNPDLMAPLLESNGGFFQNENVLFMEVIPEFQRNDFGTRRICPGDRIVLIDDDHSRIITEYPEGGGTFTSQGREFTLNGGCYDLTEDADQGTNDLFPDATNSDLFDNTLNGLIDETEELHLEKQFFDRAQRDFFRRPVRYINYMWDQYEVGDTLQRGLIVPNQKIRERMAEDENFRNLILDYQEALNLVHVNGGYRSPGAFDNYFRNHHTSAPMIDESREDYFDNNKAWDAMQDDVGLDGVPFSGARGEGDGFPTSGAGTPFPGEPNIDKTSVAESDMIGISSVTFPLAGSLGDGPSFARDGAFWRNRMLPGNLGDEAQPGDDTDILVTSSLFPLQRGQTERFSVAITVAQTNIADYDAPDGDRDKVNDNLDEAFNAYEADYQFATAPPAPNVTAVAGDGRVTLYWDDIAEEHFDRYLSRLPGNTEADARNFQGYKVYRSTDPGFQDILNITDARGNRIFRQPLAVFDLENEWSGLHPVDINGVKFNLGSNSGLQRKFVDENVVNGRRYYYAVTSYSFGNVQNDIAPSESPIFISINPDGSVDTGPNVNVVTPAASKAGYIDPENPEATPVRGTTSGRVFVEVIDPREIRVDDLYRVVFEDTLIPSGRDDRPDTLRTKNFSLLNISTGDSLIRESQNFNMEDNPVREGFRLTLDNAELELSVNMERSGWLENEEYEQGVHPFAFFLEGTPRASDYLVVFDELGVNQSIDTTYAGIDLPQKDVNFRIFNTSITDDDGNPIEVEFALNDAHNNPTATANDPNETEPGEFSAGPVRQGPFVNMRRDQIFIYEPVGDVQRELTWTLFMNPTTEGTGSNRTAISRNPRAGDTLQVFTRKPFTSLDVFEFRMSDIQVGMVDNEKIRDDLERIRVVPNPYIATNPYEPAPTMARPDQVRELHFTRLPVPGTIRIFTVSGELVQTIELTESNTFNGTYKWDMLTKDNLELAYGVYVYHIEVPGIGEHVSRFAVIK
ncbi:hypothetical protein [Natronogracilivirga saccharolytica]|uniref:Por secretion system C-terminal sorting domain-containing protein n=1 Tax=Natronogracilivirga saccharolytica TaxID=2812953 RepID=A0A8J7UTC9_9BACT|nr:hypothetical protein [Natronogracilivirga saccharolytica]MBP3191210.1 hypothetical protein [Natronogracilivirga saccharolytica]